ncbi:DNA glycosylase [Corchorus olitorius]|uniref:DNA glycosylase n=1 Tax=Corchorus olitorius TaxID=93759 RepID=A0A1R3HMW6_9ROSI|nr:DNA glycosylase [Corchorus olitorius]
MLVDAPELHVQEAAQIENTKLEHEDGKSPKAVEHESSKHEDANTIGKSPQKFLNEVVELHKSLDLERLQNTPPNLAKYPIMDSIQKYLWPRLCTLDQKMLYELHYQMITFGKVFCTERNPNCNACPMRTDCKHFASAFALQVQGLHYQDRLIKWKCVQQFSSSNCNFQPFTISISIRGFPISPFYTTTKDL